MNQPLVEITNLSRWALNLPSRYGVQVVLDNTENLINLMVVVNLKVSNITINNFGMNENENEKIRKEFKIKVLKECYKVK